MIGDSRPLVGGVKVASGLRSSANRGLDGSLRGALVLLSMIFTSDMVGLLASSSCMQRRPMWTHLTILSTGYDKSSMSRMVPWVQWLQTCELIAVVARYIELILNLTLELN